MANIRKPVNAVTEEKIRTSLFDRRDRLGFHRDPKYYRVWINDVRDEINRYLEAGFTFVSEDERWGRVNAKAIDAGSPMDSRAAVNVGRAGGQENVTAYLMQLPIEEWELMRAERQKAANEPLRKLKEQAELMKRNDAFYGDTGIK